MYVIKVKGKKKIPDYIQIRDDEFMLIGYFSLKSGNTLTRLDKFGLEGREEDFRKFVDMMPFGKLQKLEF